MGFQKGFTTMQATIAVALVATLAAIALPSYSRYVQRAKLQEAFSTLESLRAQMELQYPNLGSYGQSDCAIGARPADLKYFTFRCDIHDSQQSYLITAKGKGDLADYNFTIDNKRKRVTIDFPGVSGLPASCWMDRPGNCAVN